MIRNPWVRNSLYFRCGFWDIEPNSMNLYHVTPRYKNILDSGGLKSRMERGDEFQTLGGPHKISISSYGSLNMAFYTLIYLYRVWQIKNKLFFEGDMKNFSELNKLNVKNLWTMLEEDSNFTALNIVDAIRKRLNQPNPIVFSDDWAIDTNLEDLRIIKFRNNFSHLYLDTLYFYSSDVELSSFNQESIRNLSSISKEKSYFSIFPYDKTNLPYTETKIYELIESAIELGNRYIHYPLSGFELLNRLGLDEYKCKKYITKDNIIKFENITIDLKDQRFKIDEICTYNTPEQEFRIFKSVPKEEFIDIYSVEDALLVAMELNGGVEPYLWDMSFQLKESETIKSIYLSSFES